MGRVRTVNGDLPKHLYKNRGYFVYRRPDKGGDVGLGPDEKTAVATAEALNAAFGVDECSARMPAAFFHKKIHENKGALPEWLKARMQDLFPSLIAKEKLQTWAHSGSETQFKGNSYIGSKEVCGEQLPAWAALLFRSTRKNAAAREIEFALSEEDFAGLINKSSGYCAVTGIRLRHDEARQGGKRIKRPWAPSVDRIDSSQGYTPANCRIVCVAANLGMSLWGEEVLIEMAKAIAKKHLKAR